MPFVPVENVAELELRMTQDGQKVENTLYFLAESGWDAGGLEALCEAALDWWNTFYAPNANPIVTLREVVATDLTTETSGQFVLPAVGAIGGNTGAPLPNHVTFAIGFKTAMRGRSFRGRNYVIGLNEDDRNGPNDLDVEVVEAWRSAYDQILTADGLGGTYTWVVVSRFSGVDTDGKPIPREAGVATPVASVVASDNIIDSQRRRLPGRGQ